jgi:hypothetical protein
MGIRAGALLPSLGLLAALSAAACESHLAKLPVTEIPIEQFEGTPVSAPLGEAAPVTPIVVDGEPAAPPASAAAANVTAPSAAPVPAAAVSKAPAGPPPSAVEPSATPEEKVDAAIKLMKTGKKADVLAARKVLYNDVASGSCTQGEAKMLRTVCLKLKDQACVLKAVSNIK